MERDGRWWELRSQSNGRLRVLATYDLWRCEKPDEVFRLLTKYIEDWQWCEQESLSLRDAAGVEIERRRTGEHSEEARVQKHNEGETDSTDGPTGKY
jgi:hypothetical protein